MIAHDIVNRQDLEVDRSALIRLMDAGRQVDFVLPAPKTDADGYITWDTEHWSQVKANKYVRTYELDGKQLREFNHFNVYDMADEFVPEKAAEIRIS